MFYDNHLRFSDIQAVTKLSIRQIRRIVYEKK
jgi:hypothetical protein